MSKTISNTVYYSISIYVEFFIGLIISVLLARSLQPEDYGHYSFYMWVSALLMLLINGGMPTALTKFISELGQNEPDRMNHAIAKIRKIYYFSTILVIGAFVATVSLLHNYLQSGEYTLYMIIAMAVLFKSKYMQYVGYYKGFENFRALAVISLYIPPVNMVIVAIVAFVLPEVTNFLFAYLTVSILYMLFAMRLDKNTSQAGTGNGVNDSELNRRIFRHYYISSVLTFLNFLVFKQSEIFFLKIYVDEHALAFFNIGFLLGTSAALLIPGIYSGLLLPIMSRLYNRSEDRIRATYLNAVRYLVILGFPLIIITFIIGKLLIETMYGSAYSQAYPALLGCIVAATIQTIASAATSLMTGTDKHNILLIVLLVGGTLKLIIDIAMIQWLGLDGAIIAYVVTSLLVSLAYMTFISRHYSMQHEYGLYLKITLLAVISGIIPELIIIYFHSPVLLLVVPVVYGFTYIILIAKTNCFSSNEMEKFQQLFVKLRNKLVRQRR